MEWCNGRPTASIPRESNNRIGKCGNIPLYVDGGQNIVRDN